MSHWVKKVQSHYYLIYNNIVHLLVLYGPDIHNISSKRVKLKKLILCKYIQLNNKSVLETIGLLGKSSFRVKCCKTVRLFVRICVQIQIK